MVEPQHKRVKLPKEQYNPSTNHQKSKNLLIPLEKLRKLHYELPGNCLCQLDLDDILDTLQRCNLYFSQPSNITQDVDVSLQYASLLCLFFEIALKQKNKGIICRRISEVVLAGDKGESEIIQILSNFLSHDNKYLSYSAVRTFVSLLLIMEIEACEQVVQNLCQIIRESDNALKLGHSLEIIRRVIEFKDIDEHPLDSSKHDQPPQCQYIKISLTEVRGVNEVKYVLIKYLDDEWPELLAKFPYYLENLTSQDEHVVTSFLSLWEALISVRNNLNVEDTKEFYGGLNLLINPLLSGNAALVVWSNVMNLFNEVLCYGSTLALQEVIAEEPCNLAAKIIRAVNVNNFLDFVPCGQSAENRPKAHTATKKIVPVSVNENSEVTHSRIDSQFESGTANKPVLFRESFPSTSKDNQMHLSHCGYSNITKNSLSNCYGRPPEFDNSLSFKNISSSMESNSNKSNFIDNKSTSLPIKNNLQDNKSKSHNTVNLTNNFVENLSHDDRHSIFNPSSSESLLNFSNSLNSGAPNTSSENNSTATLEKSINGLQILQNCYEEDLESEAEEEERYISNQSKNTPIINSKESQKANFDKETGYLSHELDDIIPSSSSEEFSSSSHRSDIVFHKVVLLVLKSIAVTVKEARGDVSSSSSECSSSGSGIEEIDMEIIGRSLKEVLVKLDRFVKSRVPYHPECVVAEWLVRLFASQDDWMVEAMVCGLDIYSGLRKTVRCVSQEIEVWLNPHTSFIAFLSTVSFDHTVLLDLLVSNETCFLLYLLRYLKLTKSSWPQGSSDTSSAGDTKRAVGVMFALRNSIDRLVSKKLFPYNITPVLRLLDQCYSLFRESKTTL